MILIEHFHISCTLIYSNTSILPKPKCIFWRTLSWQFELSIKGMCSSDCVCVFLGLVCTTAVGKHQRGGSQAAAYPADKQPIWPALPRDTMAAKSDSEDEYQMCLATKKSTQISGHVDCDCRSVNVPQIHVSTGQNCRVNPKLWKHPVPAYGQVQIISGSLKISRNLGNFTLCIYMRVRCVCETGIFKIELEIID